MRIAYNFNDIILSMEWLQYEFMRKAFLAIIIITPIFGILGTMIVNKKMAFFSDALGHSAITGIAIGVLLGISNSTISMIIFGILFALFLNDIKQKSKASTDTIISVFASCGLAIGLAILSMNGNFSQYNNLLIGDILSITDEEIMGLFITLILTILFWIFAFNTLHAMSINASLAKSKNLKVNLVENLFVVLIAIIVMLAIRWVGLLIINALLILPAASSRNIAHNVREYHLFSIVISMFSGIVGLILSYYFSIATGPMIVIVTSIIFFLTLYMGNERK